MDDRRVQSGLRASTENVVCFHDTGNHIVTADEAGWQVLPTQFDTP